MQPRNQCGDVPRKEELMLTMVEKEIKIDSFDVRRSFLGGVFTVFALFPFALSILKLIDIKNTAG